MEGCMMKLPLRTPEQLLAYKSISQLLAAKSTGVASVSPSSLVFDALLLMENRNIGFLVVLEQEELVGVVSERDYARKVILVDRASRNTPVRDIMTETVLTAALSDTVPYCMVLMTEKCIRHLPIMDGNRVIGVLSMRDLLKEIITHHERLIRDMELERMAMMNSGSGSY
jgi:CBS domain-containing protein